MLRCNFGRLRPTILAFRPTVCFNLKFSSSSTHNPPAITIYNGKFASKLRWLRILSLSSSIFSSIGFPLLIYLDVANPIPMAAKVGITSTIIFASVSSTIFLSIICSPYVTQMTLCKDHPDINKCTIEATRVSLFGRQYTTKFTPNDVRLLKSTLMPFASFQVDGKGTFYTYDEGFAQEKTKSLFLGGANKS
jgi:hypothetical protein